ncbi:hypothetical protein ACGF3G_09815 [Streptomyces sp. NPDC048179]|uniref:hypothetical protein n=1 Tax=Streptomyces sp. NPDC048179 TaxID=3365506 RepID=UPI00371E0050
MSAKVAKLLVDAPHFLRLGFMLALERRLTEPRGRTVLLQVRAISHQKTVDVVKILFPYLDRDDVQTLTISAIAGADSLFVHRKVTSDAVDLVAPLEMQGARSTTQPPL